MPYKNIEARRLYNKLYHRKHKDKDAIYYLKNRERILAQKKVYAEKNETKIRSYREKLKLLAPWRSSYFNAKNRCMNKKNQDYQTYGGRGIKFLLTQKEMKALWIRDKAKFLKSPTIDRINNQGNYEFSNCRFIERSENATKGNFESRWKK